MAAEAEKRGGLSRRGLVVGGGAVLLGGAAYTQRDTLGRWWWRLPGTEKPRREGEVDFPGAEWVAASPANWRRANRPDDYRIDRVVVHVIQGSYAVALKVFGDPGHRAATHYVLRTDDGHVAQAVRELDVAYHAGNRSYNERSIGIEHEGFVDRPTDFTDNMYLASARLTANICDRHGIPKDREHIIGHNEVPGADHTDPGPHWDWPRYLRMVRDARPVPSPSPTPSVTEAGDGP
ncbi:N-acetylmuramoyl-L-alanine amidase [Streptomyces alkaliterrae]|uniref:N-acetylmuramoyl-L-alanine amidase n=1 Tax=Streptomyces alkaliterrae TaxID=2213162 RepID=A0A5P0YPK4_9ACTN|nr:N-acetylmuramoyl-L-alanine amidase [Streptomyces alkaliterrae]MBB1258694.1 N-acetylmuramoyl-L-alanine amidase [Streptomyces alkaliterrae]MQS02178.1 N-acetylmuramoyl-L-alanine amidase [Streptomyces alkaliterrae]